MTNLSKNYDFIATLYSAQNVHLKHFLFFSFVMHRNQELNQKEWTSAAPS